MDPISQGLAGNAIWAAITAAARAVLGRKIEITCPRPQDKLSQREIQGETGCYRVDGILKHLPEGHEIWLLTEDQGSRDIRPQGFCPIQYDQHRKTWFGLR
jgi:hypothetical protein